MIQSKFFSHAFVDSEIAEVVDRWLWSEWSSVQMRSAPCPFLLHFFFVKRQSQTALSFWCSLDMTRSTTELLQIGLEATTFVLIRQMLSVAFEVVEVFWPVFGSYSPYANIWTPSCPPHRHGKPGDFGSLFFFCVHFPRFLKFLAPRLKKYKYCNAAEPSGAWSDDDREICRRHFEAHLALWWNRALPPPFFLAVHNTPLLVQRMKKCSEFFFLSEVRLYMESCKVSVWESCMMLACLMMAVRAYGELLRVYCCGEHLKHNCGLQPEFEKSFFLRFCRTWTKRYLITSQTWGWSGGVSGKRVWLSSARWLGTAWFKSNKISRQQQQQQH